MGPTPTTLTTAESGTTVTGTPVTDSDGAVSYAIAATGDTAGCSLVSSTAPVVLDFTTNGHCSVTVSTAATATYAADSVTVPFVVLAIPTFAWSPSPTSFTLGQSPQDLASATTNSDGVITYAVLSAGNSANCSLASSSAPVDLSFTADGTCTLSASLAASTSYTSAAPVSQLFTVGLMPQAITFTGTAPTDVRVNSTYTPSATGGGSGNPVTFSVDASSSAVCSYGGGIVSFNAVGSCVIDANQPGNSTYADAPQVQQTVAVGLATQAITFSPPTSGPVGGSATLSATGGASGNPVVFTVDSTTGAGVCNVAGTNGTTVEFTAAGNCVIDANQAGDTTYGPAPQVQQTIAIGLTSQAITFTSTAPTDAMVNGTYDPAATGGASGNLVTFAIDSSSSTVCSYSGAIVTFDTAGTCVIDASQAGNSTYADAPQVQQTITVGLVPQTISFTGPTIGAVNGSAELTATATSTLLVTLSVDGATTNGACSLSAATVDYLAVGSCVLDANQVGNATYATAPQVQQTVAIGLAPQAITFNSAAPSDALVDGTYSPSATGGASGNPVTFSIDAGSNAVCSYSDGTVSFNAAGSCVVDANQAGNASYAVASQAQQTIGVGLIPQAISFTAPSSGGVGGSAALSAVGGASGNAVTFSVDAASGPGACHVSGANGITVNYSAVGNCVIDANQAGNASYAVASQAEQTIGVGLIPQTITFRGSLIGRCQQFGGPHPDGVVGPGRGPHGRRCQHQQRLQPRW